MTDMRLVVAGAGGRMGQTLIRLIAEEAGVVLAGALEGPGSAAIGPVTLSLSTLAKPISG